MQLSRRVVVFISVFFFAIVLRGYKFIETIEFGGDQGSDFIIAREIVKGNHWPLVGPILSVSNLYVPPTYYYLLALFLVISQNPVHVSFFFLFMNLSALLLLFFIVRNLADDWAGVIAMVLFSLSHVMVFQSRTAWQPHPITFFLLLALWFLVKAFQTRRAIYAMFSIFFYIFSMSFYPSPLVLFPFFFLLAVRFYRFVLHERLIPSVLKSALCFLASFVLVYSPQIIFEMKFGWPSVQTLITPSFGLVGSFFEMVLQFAINGIMLFDSFFMANIIHARNFVFYDLGLGFAFLFMIVLGIFLRRADAWSKLARNTVFSPESSVGLALGFMLLIFYQEAIYGHRLWSFLPIMFIFLSLHARRMFSGLIAHTTITLVVLAGYILGNGLMAYASLAYPSKEYPLVQQVNGAIVGDIQERGLDARQFFVMAFTLYDPWNYELATYLYAIQSIISYPVSFTATGNDIDREDAGKIEKEYTYLICIKYMEYRDIIKGCTGSFLRLHPHYSMIQKTLFEKNTMLFIFKKDTPKILENGAL